MNIITNNKPRPLLALYELPEKAQAEFDYVLPDDGSCRFVKYKGWWHDCFDMQRTTDLSFSPFHYMGWHGIASDSYFSGVLVRFVDDDQVIVGRYFS